MKNGTVSCICLVALGLGHSAPAAAELLYAQSNLQPNGGKLTPVNYRTGPTSPVGTTVNKDAIDVSEEEDCGRRMDEKLAELAQRLNEVRSAPSSRELSNVARKIGDLEEDAEDACGKRGSKRLLKKLDRVTDAIKKAKETLK